MRNIKKQEEILEKIVKKGLTVSQTEKLVKEALDDKVDLSAIKTSLSSSLTNNDILAGYAGYISYKALEVYIRFYANKIGVDLSTIQISEKENGNSNNDIEHQMVEGRLMEDKVLRRVRNRAARQKCLEDSNFTCCVCGFNFYKVYGEIGKDFIEVHHTKPLSSYNEEHEVLQSELVALCSNCHSMVHRRRPMPYSIDEIKRILEENSTK